MQKQLISSGAIWEKKVGYSRAVKVGNVIEVSGTTSVKDGEPYLPHDYYGQTLRIYEIINDALAQAGSSLDDIVRIRVYVEDITQWEFVAQAHASLFADIRPAMTMVGVAGLIDPRLVVEIEATAIIQ
jgi:enamine deaminase RidA (YjgF/YER057c/UK114 family)